MDKQITVSINEETLNNLDQIVKLKSEYKKISIEEVAKEILEQYTSKALLNAESVKRTVENVNRLK